MPGLPKEQVNLADWARICCRRGAIDQIMDPYLRGNIDPVCLEKFGEIAESCLRDQGTQRPTMSDVVCGLEFALQLQETAENTRNSMIDVSGGHKHGSKSTISSGERSIAKTDPDRMSSDTVFSEIMNQKGR
ncbi:hypothetical protein GH714_031029 [Hevea brasiliensis]|uniref:Serine-threonine/tyrosine-protein kinase catalytic domain-containing protein n=1 Tax=Hevea brasiliensis TaxID=3981 RepID=A0A6A6LF88_HEVBR|nr:hypothetical protein GH714_031029 [Hevea brasiliensis]